MDFLSNMTNKDIMLIGLLAFACVLIFPNLIRRRRIQKQIFEKKKKGEPIRPEDFTPGAKLFYTHNANPSEIEEFLAKLKTHAFKHEMKIVFPGSISFQGKKSPTTMILVGRFGLLLIRCYGFGGHIYTEHGKSDWYQNMNEAIKEIPNPVRSMQEEKALMSDLLKKTEFARAAVFCASVFTRPNVILSAPTDSNVYDRRGFFEWLESAPLFEKDAQIPVKKLADFLAEAVKRG
ncbi:MAG: hypothetical protein HFE83_11250 [Lachnospiraceae bacterium]|nr:hypothetical protein [Lachnospiraceae bacterium]